MHLNPATVVFFQLDFREFIPFPHSLLSQVKLSGVRQSKMTKRPILAGLGGKGLRRRVRQIGPVNSFPPRYSLLTSKIVQHQTKGPVFAGLGGKGLSLTSTSSTDTADLRFTCCSNTEYCSNHVHQFIFGITHGFRQSVDTSEVDRFSVVTMCHTIDLELFKYRF